MVATNRALVMTLANSIIGVSILAMPFCFKQCGIVLASTILILSNIMTRLSCYYLLKSAIMSRRRTFEFLAFHVFGRTGKMAVELSIILLMIGTCIAFFVVMGDLGPQILANLVNFESTAALRPSVLIGLAVFVVLPLGLLRNVDSLGYICTASFAFYLCLVFKVSSESVDNLLRGNWLNDVSYWRPSGILQCLPIFSMALSCQTQLFEIFDSVLNSSLDRMNAIVKSAVNICTALYIGVGFFGYVAYYNKHSFTGNVLVSFSESFWSEVIKMGFVLSVAVTFPLVIFPCRASLNSLLFRKVHVPQYELVTSGGGSHIPEARFKCLTLFIITVSLAIGLIAPNIEIVLGLLGSTIGVIICILFPPLIFLWISTKATSERLLAQVMIVCGIFVMVMGTYANLYLAKQASPGDQLHKMQDIKQIDASVVPLNVEKVINPGKLEDTNVEVPHIKEEPEKIPKIEEPKIVKNTVEIENERKEPPIPIPPDASNVSPQPAAPPEPPKIDSGPKVDAKEKSQKKEDTQQKKIDQSEQKNVENQVKDVEKSDSVKLKQQNVENKGKNVKQDVEKGKNQQVEQPVVPMPEQLPQQGNLDQDRANVEDREKRDLVSETARDGVSLEYEGKNQDGSFVGKITGQQEACDKNQQKDVNGSSVQKIEHSTEKPKIVEENQKRYEEKVPEHPEVLAPEKLSDPEIPLEKTFPDKVQQVDVRPVKRDLKSVPEEKENKNENK